MDPLSRRKTPRAFSRFDHSRAQEYEIASARQWLRESHGLVADLLDRAAQRRPGDLFLREFMAGSLDEWDAFASHLEGRPLLDVGAGPLPAAVLMPWASPRIVIDPLARSYSESVLETFGMSWFDELTVHSVEAERFVPDLEDAISGAIVCRNALDHMGDPFIVLANLAAYAAVGCRLLLWTDLDHPEGGDAGHRSITGDRGGFRRLIEQLGFRITRETPDKPDHFSFGCYGIRR